MKIKFYYYIIIATLFLSCDENSELNSIKVTNNIIDNLKLSEISTIEKVIPIELDSLKIFSEINNIFSNGDELFIHSENPSMISSLDKTGKVIKQIQPDSSNPFLIDGITEIKLFENSIYVLDREHFKIYKLNTDLEIISKIKIEFYVQSFLPLENEKYLLYTGHEITDNNKGMFIFYDSKSNEILQDLVKIDINTPNFLKFLTTNHISINDNGNIFFWDSTKNSIMEFNTKTEKLDNIVKIDYGSSQLPEKFYETSKFDNSYDFLTKMRKSNYAFRHFNLKSNNTFVNFIYEKSGGFVNSLYNFKTNTTYNYKNIEDDLITELNIPGFGFFTAFMEDKTFIIHMPFELLENSENSIAKSALVKEQDILVFGTFK